MNKETIFEGEHFTSYYIESKFLIRHFGLNLSYGKIQVKKRNSRGKISIAHELFSVWIIIATALAQQSFLKDKLVYLRFFYMSHDSINVQFLSENGE